VEKKIIVDSKKGIGLVLSGGGGRGAYQAGVCKAFKEAGLEFQLIVGTSVGALNGIAVAADIVDKMVKIWENIKPSQIFGINLSSLKRGALLSNEPLEKLMRKAIDEEAVKKIINSAVKLVIISSRLQDKQEEIDCNFCDFEELLDSFMGSSAIPATFPFRIKKMLLRGKKEKIREEELRETIDGGLISNFPIIEAIEFGLCKTFFTIPLYTPEIERPESKSWHYHDLPHIIMRAADIMFTSQYVKDMKVVGERIGEANALKDIMRTVIPFPWNKIPLIREKEKKLKIFWEKAPHRVYEGAQIVETTFSGELPVDMMDFTSDKAKKAAKMGYEDGRKTMEQVEII